MIKLEYMIDAGCAGRANQDAYWVKQGIFQGKQVVLAMVCDGVGGAAKGEVASRKTIDYIVGGFWSNLPDFLQKDLSMKQMGDKMDQYLQKANRYLYRASCSNGIRTGTTIALYFMLDRKYLIVNVGDSRVYWLKEKGMYRTRDHTLYERRRHGGMAPEKEKRILWQSVGSQTKVRADRYMGEVDQSMDVLLLTDGAYRPFSKQEIREYCQYGNLNKMRRQALKRKEADNMAGVRIEIR